eukprot:4651768-Prymnesium_polylepis.1
MVNEIMRGVDHSQYGKVLHLLGASPRGKHVAVCPSNSDADRSTCWAVKCTPLLHLPAGLDAGRQGWMNGCCRGVPAALQP